MKQAFYTLVTMCPFINHLTEKHSPTRVCLGLCRQSWKGHTLIGEECVWVLRGVIGKHLLKLLKKEPHRERLQFPICPTAESVSPGSSCGTTCKTNRHLLQILQLSKIPDAINRETYWWNNYNSLEITESFWHERTLVPLWMCCMGNCEEACSAGAGHESDLFSMQATRTQSTQSSVLQ